ncbi:MAG: hypothetical protein RJQ07_10725 [Pseudomonadales bacterium]
MFASLSDAIAQSALRPIVIDWLMNVPGLPPILQSIHILCVALLVATAGFLHLRMLGLALPSQELGEMFERLRPWFLWALGIAFLSGLPLVIARPDRYFFNPVAGWKLLGVSVMLLVTSALYLKHSSHPDYWTANPAQRRAGGLLSLIALAAMIVTILAGRWIAYVDYLYWE